MKDKRPPDEMPEGTPEPAAQLGRGLKWLAWLLGLTSQSFPAITYFADYAPPFFPQTGVIVSVLALAIVFWSASRERAASPRRAITYLVGSVTLVAIYSALLPYLTVMPPANREGSRRQIGFYTFEWSLTQEAKTTIADLKQKEGTAKIEVTTADSLMNIFGVWGGQSGVDHIWPLWSIALAGALLFVLFLLGFGLWAYGIGILLRTLETR